MKFRRLLHDAANQQKKETPAPTQLSLESLEDRTVLSQVTSLPFPITGLSSLGLFSPVGTSQNVQNAATNAVSVLNSLGTTLSTSGLSTATIQKDLTTAIQSLRSASVLPVDPAGQPQALALDNALRTFTNSLLGVSNTLTLDSQLSLTPSSTLLGTVASNARALASSLGSFTSGTPTSTQLLTAVQSAVNGSLSNAAANLAALSTAAGQVSRSTTSTTLLNNVLSDVTSSIRAIEGSLDTLANTLPTLSGLSTSDAPSLLQSELTTVRNSLSGITTTLGSLASKLPTVVPSSEGTQAQLAANLLNGIASDLNTLSSNLGSALNNLSSSSLSSTMQTVEGLLRNTAAEIGGLAANLGGLGVTTNSTPAVLPFSDAFFTNPGWFVSGFFGGSVSGLDDE